MSIETVYEWDCETWDLSQVDYEANHERGGFNLDAVDDINHSHSDKLIDAWLYAQGEWEPTCIPVLVLVRDTIDSVDGVIDRSWAYVRNGKLDTHFRTAYDVPCCLVPKRFRQEFNRVFG